MDFGAPRRTAPRRGQQMYRSSYEAHYAPHYVTRPMLTSRTKSEIQEMVEVIAIPITLPLGPVPC